MRQRAHISGEDEQSGGIAIKAVDEMNFASGCLAVHLGLKQGEKCGPGFGRIRRGEQADRFCTDNDICITIYHLIGPVKGRAAGGPDVDALGGRCGCPDGADDAAGEFHASIADHSPQRAGVGLGKQLLEPSEYGGD